MQKRKARQAAMDLGLREQAMPSRSRTKKRRPKEQTSWPPACRFGLESGQGLTVDPPEGRWAVAHMAAWVRLAAPILRRMALM